MEHTDSSRVYVDSRDDIRSKLRKSHILWVEMDQSSSDDFALRTMMRCMRASLALGISVAKGYLFSSQQTKHIHRTLQCSPCESIVWQGTFSRFTVHLGQRQA